MAFTASTVWEVQTGGLDDFQTVSAVVAAGGSGYAAGNVLTLSGGTSTTAATFTVATVDGSGAVLTVTPTNIGHYTVLPANPVSVTGGAGTLCTLTVTWNIGGNGGGFDTGVAGFPTDGAISSANTASPVLSSASYNFVTGDATAGAWAYLKAGTGVIAGWYKIVSCAGNAATLDAAIGHVVLATGGLNAVVGCSTSASLTSITWGVDYSQSATPILSFTDMVIDGTTNTKFTSAAHPVGKNFVGNIINVTGGSGFTVQRVAIVSTVTTTATCDKSLGTLGSTGGTGNMGGAYGSLGGALVIPVASPVSGQSIFVKAGAYSINTSSQNVPQGPMHWSPGGGNPLAVYGYSAFRYDYGTAPVFTSGVASITVIYTRYSTIANLTVNGGGFASITGFDYGRRTSAYKLTAISCANGMIGGSSGISPTVFCRASNCTTGFWQLNCLGCEATGCNIGFNACNCAFCIASGGGVGFDISAQGIYANCLAYGNTSHGFSNADDAGDSVSLVNCIAEANGGKGFLSNSTTSLSYLFNALVNCAAYNNTQGNFVGWREVGNLVVNLIDYTASAFVNAAGGNFALDNNNPGGAQLRAAGIPGVFPAGLTTGYLDIGAAQHQDSPAMIVGGETPVILESLQISSY